MTTPTPTSEQPAPAQPSAAPTVKATPRTPVPRVKIGPYAAIGALVALLGALVAVTTLGWKWGLLLCAGAAVLAVAAWVAWRRLRAGKRAGRSSGRTSRSASGRPTLRSRLAGMRSRLPRFLGGTKTGRGSTSGASGAGAPGGRKRGLFDRSRNPRGGSVGGSGSQRRGRLFGRGKRQAASGSSDAPATGRRRGRGAGRSPGGSAGKTGKGKSTGTTTTGTSGPGSAGGGSKKRWLPWKRRPKGNSTHSTNDPGIDKPTTKPTDKPADTAPTRDKPTPKNNKPDGPAARPGLTDPPADPAARNTGGSAMSGQHTRTGGYEDRSLVGAGESLKTAPNDIEELRLQWEQAARSAEEDQPFSDAVREGHNQIVKKLREAEELAGALYGDFRGGNEADIERYENPRGGNHRVEGKADVQSAQRDN